jgi:hypothetical protein
MYGEILDKSLHLFMNNILFHQNSYTEHKYLFENNVINTMTMKAELIFNFQCICQ